MHALHSLVLPTSLSLCVEKTRGRACTQVMRLERGRERERRGETERERERAERERESIKRLGATSSATAARGWHKVGRAEGTGDSPIPTPRPRPGPGPDPLWSCWPPATANGAGFVNYAWYLYYRQKRPGNHKSDWTADLTELVLDPETSQRATNRARKKRSSATLTV